MVTGANLKLTLRLLLPCFMLMAQSLAFAHEFDHPSASDGNSCVVCPVSANVEAAATDSGDRFRFESVSARVAIHPDRAWTDSLPVAAIARGPPRFL